MKHINIPVFIPHLGCPHNCVFCNQRSISGKTLFDVGSVDSEIATALSTILPGSAKVEIAFFGGSFTGIERSLMVNLLEKANRYLSKGCVSAIRISTRPDYIDREILSVLKEYRVTDIELGIQSTNNQVLAQSRRGHTAKQALNACSMVLERGFHLVGQMMVGLPASSRNTEIQTARDIVKVGAQSARIYPAVVFKNTVLEQMATAGEYLPLEPAEQIARCVDVLDIFAHANVKVLRIGLCAQENLCDGSAVAVGSYDAAIGERVQSELFYRHIISALGSSGNTYREKTLNILCPPGATSKVVGHKQCNLDRLRTIYGINALKVIEKNSLVGYNIVID